MSESDYYPANTYNNPEAPWNEKVNKPKNVEVTVSITLSKTVEVEVDDYTAEEDFDEDGYQGITYDFSECNLEQTVRDQITLPNSIEEFNDWNEDDFAVKLEN